MRQGLIPEIVSNSFFILKEPAVSNGLDRTLA